MPVLHVAPVYVRSTPVFNGRPSVLFTPVARLAENTTSPSVTHYVVVASHKPPTVKVNESLATLQTTDVRDAILAAATGNGNANKWASTMGKFELDGLDQSASNQIQPDGKAHVYRVTLNGGWPAAPTVIGARVGSTQPGWEGSVAEVIGVDDTWSEQQVQSLTRGLMFKYHVGQDDSTFLTPAQGVLTGQDPAGISVSLDQVTGQPGMISGTVSIPDARAIGYLPTVAPDSACRAREYRGPVAGLWLGLSQVLHLIEVYSLPTPTTPLSAQYRLGRYEMDANRRWSTGQDEVHEGYKVCRPVRRGSYTPIDYDAYLISTGLNAQVALYTEAFGVKILEAIVPLRPDNTFFGKIGRPGVVIAELRKISDTTVFATSRRTLPQTTLGDNSASLRELALTVLALVSLPPKFHFRAQQILVQLAAIQGSDGSVPTRVNVVNPSVNDGAWESGTMALIAVAALKYQSVTGDPQFVNFATKIGTLLQGRVNVHGVPVQLPGAARATAVDAVLAYWLWDALGMAPLASLAAKALQAVFWQPDLNRCARWADTPVVDAGLPNTTIDTGHDLWTDLWTGLFFHAIRDQGRALKAKASLGAFRRRGIPIQLLGVPVKNP